MISYFFSKIIKIIKTTISIDKLITILNDDIIEFNISQWKIINLDKNKRFTHAFFFYFLSLILSSLIIGEKK